MVARYFTGTYSTNPWTEVDDQSCLRSGCHAKRVLLGRELYKGVLFDHQPHLTEMRREKQLRCTSCHSQIVQGSHIAVTPTTCFLCHFKNTTPQHSGTARCTLCHAIPEKTITTAGLSFDHGDVKRFGMDCMACHEGVIKGDGEVPRERCFTCHNDTARLERYGETEFLHRMHVTDHKVECLHCHIEIRHKIPAREEALSTGCAELPQRRGRTLAACATCTAASAAKDVAPQPARCTWPASAARRATTGRGRPPGRQRGELHVVPRPQVPHASTGSWQAGLKQRVDGMREPSCMPRSARLAAHDGAGGAWPTRKPNFDAAGTGQGHPQPRLRHRPPRQGAPRRRRRAHRRGRRAAGRPVDGGALQDRVPEMPLRHRAT